SVRVQVNFFLLMLILLPSGPTLSQNQLPDSAEQPIKLSADLVVIDAQALDRKTGRPVGNLRKEDFLVYEDGVRQEITHFSQDKFPLSIIILLDASGSVRPIMNQLRDVALQTLRLLKPEDEVALMATASRTEVIEGFTADREAVARKIETLDEKKLGSRGILLNEALYQAAKYMSAASNPNSRRSIIVVTDDASTQMIFEGHSKQEALHEIRENDINVCGLVTSRRLVDAGMFLFKKIHLSSSIKSYAEETGGLVLSAGKQGLSSKFADLINHLRTRYTLAYFSSNTKADGKFRRIKVEVSPDVERREGRLSVLAKRGYHARRSKSADEKTQTPDK
ncbi:MAG: VWA domain-containing protein, partial [Acidobacteriota bacterium]